MTKRRISLSGLVLLMLVIGVWAVLPKHSRSSVTEASGPVTETQTRKEAAQSASKPINQRRRRICGHGPIQRWPRATLVGMASLGFCGSLARPMSSSIGWRISTSRE
jgi:hypothetical protein